MKWSGVLIIWVSVGVFLLSGVTYLRAGQTDRIDKDLRQKKRDLGKIKKELSLTKEREKEIRGRESSILESLSSLEKMLYAKEKELAQMETQLVQIKERRQQTQIQVDVLNQGVDQTRGEFFSRLTALYKMGRMSPANFFLSSRSYQDLLRIDKYLRVIIDSDARLVESFRHQVTLKKRYQDSLAQDQVQWQRAIEDVEKKKAEVKKVREEKRVLLKSIQNQKATYQKLIGELESRAKDFQTLIERLEKEKSQFAYGKSKPDVPKGKMIVPLQGKVISLFKDKGQNGIEIKAPMGTEIKAVLPGKVLYSDWFKGFGNVVIIDHGDHLFTVSGYSSHLVKKAGDAVSQGETIAFVGSEGSLKGPCLYFEVRHRGKPQNPMEWIPQLEKVISLQEGSEKGRNSEGGYYVSLERKKKS